MSLISQKNILILCAFCTTLEWYDFAVFTSMSSVLINVFFPDVSKKISYIYIYGIFATGFIARPMGAIFFSYIGDKFGRKISLTISLVVMTFSTFLIGFLPTYNYIGISSSLLLTLLRLLQGFSVSSEHTGTIVYLSEVVPNDKKFFSLSICFTGVMFGSFLGTIVSLFFIYYLSSESLAEYGWRLPFIISIILGYVTYKLRINMIESISYSNKKDTNPIFDLFKGYKSEIFKIAGMFCFNSVVFYSVFIYIPTDLISSQLITKEYMLVINSINMLIMVTTIILFGFFSDVYGETNYLLYSLLCFLALVYPLLALIYTGKVFCIFLSQCILGILNGIFLAPTPVIYTSLFPKEVRYSGVTIGLNVSATVFGGSAPLVMTALSSSNSVIYQSIYMMLAAFFALIVINPKYDFFIKK